MPKVSLMAMPMGFYLAFPPMDFPTVTPRGYSSGWRSGFSMASLRSAFPPKDCRMGWPMANQTVKLMGTCSGSLRLENRLVLPKDWLMEKHSGSCSASPPTESLLMGYRKEWRSGCQMVRPMEILTAYLPKDCRTGLPRGYGLGSH